MPVTVYVDADACPVQEIVESVAREHRVPVVLLCDTNHVLRSSYARVITVDAGRDAVDLALANLCGPGDLAVTQDYGVAALALAKGAFAIHPTGLEFTPQNIESLLAQRAMAQKARRASGKHHMKGPAKRTAADDHRFAAALEALLKRKLRGI